MDFFSSNKKFWIVAGAALGVALLLSIFQIGMNVGARKAFFTCRWSENYHRNFAGPRGGFMMRQPEPDFIESHGAFGRVLRVDSSSLVIKRPDGVEKVIDVGTGTEILRMRTRVPLSEVQVDEEAVVIGQPTEEGRVRAELVRLMPPR